jgi:putative membrane protein
MKPLIHVLAVALTLLVLSQLGVGIEVVSLYTAVIVAIIWGLMMLIIRPILTLLTLPLTIITLGLFSFILNALLFWFIASFVDGFSVAGFIPALIGSVVLSFVSAVLNRAA